MDIEATLKAGDVCLDCQKLGLKKYLRYFKINSNGDTLLKCESNECMFPYNDEFCSSDEEEKTNDNISEESSLKFIEDFIQQCSSVDEVQSKTDDFHFNENVTEQAIPTQFDITFLDDFNEMENKSLCKPELLDNNECFDNKLHVNVTKNEYPPLPTLQSETQTVTTSKEGNNEPSLKLNGDTTKDCKRKIDIQSIETIKFEIPLYNNYPTASQILPIATDIASKNYNSTDTTSKAVEFKLPKSKSCAKSKATKSNSFEIPKADIMKGNALLKKMANVSEKSTTTTKSKFARNKKIAKDEETKKAEVTPIPSPSISISSESYSVDKISKMLINIRKMES